MEKLFTKRLKSAIQDDFSDLIRNLEAAKTRAGHSPDGQCIAATLTSVRQSRAFFERDTDPQVEE
jgi:hypothetical protein